jgi:hypothetical protein
MPVFQRNKEARARSFDIGEKDRLALRAGHRDGIAFFKVQGFSGVRDVM